MSNDLTPSTVTIRGELLDVRTFREHWGIGNVRPADGPAVKVTGKFLGCDVGDTVEVTGRWETHATYGRQLKAQRVERLTPEGSAGMVKWIASRCPNVGEARARQMVERFGADLWRVIEEEPLALCVIDGITHNRATAIADAYAAFRGERDAMITLRDWGLTDHQVAQCVGRWGELSSVIRELRKDPYRLSEVGGFGFLRADVVARKMGVPHDAPARIAAGVEHVLGEARKAGHVFVGGAKLQKMAAALLGVEPGPVGRAMRASVDEGRLVLRGWRVYQPKLAAAEARCAERVRELLAAGAAGDREAGAA